MFVHSRLLLVLLCAAMLGVCSADDDAEVCLDLSIPFYTGMEYTSDQREDRAFSSVLLSGHKIAYNTRTHREYNIIARTPCSLSSSMQVEREAEALLRDLEALDANIRATLNLELEVFSLTLYSASSCCFTLDCGTAMYVSSCCYTLSHFIAALLPRMCPRSTTLGLA
jgi:hypothetical protein